MKEEPERKPDGVVTRNKIHYKKLIREARDEAINKLPNEFRNEEHRMNDNNIYSDCMFLDDIS